MPDAAPHIAYPEVMAHAGFYHHGRPLVDLVWSAEELRQVRRRADGDVQQIRHRIERATRYQAMLRSEAEGGRLGVTDIYELSGSPCIYFKRLDADLQAERLVPRLFAWQRAAWNHGQAPMLWIVSPTQVHVLDAYARPPVEQTSENLAQIELRRFERIADQLTELRETVSRQEIESRLFWNRLGRRIDRQNRVDQQLIKDLSSAAERLCECGLPLAEAHRLLLRSIFGSYLEARGWLKEKVLQAEVGVARLPDALQNPRTALKMFDWLASTFNGDVFPQAYAQPYTTKQLAELRFLLRGGDPKTGQRYLWPYEFDIVPVELLSSAYEEFTHALDPVQARTRSTHYTPMNLVDLTLSEVFDDTLFETELPLDAKVLDLACGSGVFLVAALRRLVSRRLAAGERLTRKLIRDTLYNQIFGVDVSNGAIHISAVSLYLAALELDPNPHLGNGVRFKPLIYPDDPQARSERRCFNLFAADAFDPEAEYNRQLPFANQEFAVAVGNPPWTRPRGVRAAAGKARLEEVQHLAYCRERGIPLPSQDPPDQAFLWRAADFGEDSVRFGFLLSARRAFSHHPDSREAREALLNRFAPKVVMNLSNLHREELFPSSQHPAILLIATNQPAESGARFIYAAPERLKTFKRHGTLEIGPELIKLLSVRRAATEENFLKIASWGGARDARLVEQIRSFEPLRVVLEKLGIEPRQGFIRGKAKERTRPVDPALLKKPHPCLETRGFSPFDIDSAALPLFTDKKMQWPRDGAIYRGPLLLVRLGLGQRGLEAALCDHDVVYSRRYYGVQIPSSYQLWRSCLNGILNSSLATYFIFLTAAEWGVERDNIYSDDVDRLPVPPPTASEELGAQRVAELSEEIRHRVRKGVAVPAEARDRLDEAVFGLYGLDREQRALVEDMVGLTIDLQRKAESSDQMRPARGEDLQSYAEYFAGVVNGVLSVRNESKIVAEVFGLPPRAPLRVVKFRVLVQSASDPELRNVPTPGLDPLLRRIAERVPQTLQEQLHTRRHLRVYGDRELYILKPNQRRFWTRSAGLYDADAVLAEHLRTL